MPDRFEKKQTDSSALLGAVGAAVFLTLSGAPAIAGDDGASVAAPGIKVYVDPSTGKISDTPPPGQQGLTLSPAEQNAFSRSSQGLVEVPNSGPAGGMKVNLQGRFKSPLVATVGPDGKAQIKHAGETASSPDVK